MAKKYIVGLMLFIHLLYAKDISINELITQIKHSTGDIKRQKMNLLKIKLRDANEKTRQETISKLQKVLDKHYATHSRYSGKLHNIQKSSINTVNIPRNIPTTHIRGGQNIPQHIRGGR